VDEEGFPGRFSLCGQFHLPQCLLFFFLPMEIDNLLCVPGQSGPYHIDSIPSRSLVSAPIHPMTHLRWPMTGSILTCCFKAFRNHDSLLSGCGVFPFLGMAILFTLHLLRQFSCFFAGLIEPSIPGDFPWRSFQVFLDSGDDRTQCFHVRPASLNPRL